MRKNIKKTPPKLKQRQLEIIHYLYRFRFLSGYQLQLLLKHRHHGRVNIWLKDLVIKKYLGRKRLKVKENPNRPYVYYLKKKSIKYLKSRKDVNANLLYRIYTEQNRKAKFVKHCMVVADTYLYLKKTKSKKDILYFFPKTDLKEIEYLPPTLPDAYFVVQDANGKAERYFLEVLDKDTKRFVYKKRIKEYINYSDSQEWEINTNHPFPNILFICPDNNSRKKLENNLKRELEEQINEINFYIMTEDLIRFETISD